MKWTPEQINELKDLCLSGTSNHDLAAHFGVPVTEIHAKRSQHGVTIPRCRVAQGKPMMTVNPEFEAAVDNSSAPSFSNYEPIAEELYARVRKELKNLRLTVDRIEELAIELGGTAP